MPKNNKGDHNITVTASKKGVSASVAVPLVVEDGRLVADTDRGVLQ